MTNQEQPKASDKVGSTPWYKKWWGALLVLIFFYILGPYLIWTKTNWNNPTKIITSGVLILLFFVGLFSSPDYDTSTSSNSSNDGQREVEKTEDIEVVEEVNLTEEELIERIIRNVLKGQNNMGSEYIREIKFVEQITGGLGVFIEYNADDNLTMNLRKRSIEGNMADIYSALYKSEYDIDTVSIMAYFPLVDKYGNEDYGVVYKTYLDKAEAEKINWEANESNIRNTILPDVWTTAILHPEFQ